MSHYDESPVNPLPPVVIVLALALALPELAFLAGENGLLGADAQWWRAQMIDRFGFFPEILNLMIANNVWPIERVIAIVAYPFVHGSFTGAIFAIVFVLALGKMVGEQFSAVAVLVIFFGASVFGALMYWLVQADGLYPLFGGMVGAYGLIGAYTFLLWLQQVATGGQQWQAFQLIGFLMAIQLLFSLIFGANNVWVAELAGFAAGFGLSFLVIPGGFARLRAWLRQR